MSEPILDAFRHNAWANRTLVEFCRGLSPEQLRATAGGGYGTIPETLRHLLTAESYYTSLFTGSPAEWDVEENARPSLDELARWARDMETAWGSILSQTIDGDTQLTRRRRDGSLTKVRAGLMLAQALHHGNVHREQVSAVLTAEGLEPPDLSVWAYGQAAGGLNQT